MAQRFFEGASHASSYAKFRPAPPQELGNRIVEYLKEKYEGLLETCVDVGCGNGQCVSLFASRFSEVIGTDISAAQIEVAKGLNYPENVTFHVSPAEAIPRESGSVQIVNSSQACHWFDLPAFFKEADRVLCSRGIIALSGYTFPYFTHPTKSEELQRHMTLVDERTAGYWGPGRQDIDNEYQNIVIPFQETSREHIWTKEYSLTLEELGAGLTTSSGFQNFCKDRGSAAGEAVISEFVTNCQKTLGSEEMPENIFLSVKHKYFLLMGRK